jgi:hypothetical protein
MHGPTCLFWANLTPLLLQPCEVAQTCVWFTEGTSIGCAKPSGTSPSPSPHCTPAEGLTNASNNDPDYRTMLLNVTALSKEDVFRWRGPWQALLVYTLSGVVLKMLLIWLLVLPISSGRVSDGICVTGTRGARPGPHRSGTRAAWRAARRCGATPRSPSTTRSTPSRATSGLSAGLLTPGGGGGGAGGAPTPIETPGRPVAAP